jgi:PAS domain S-box-containing protein
MVEAAFPGHDRVGVDVTRPGALALDARTVLETMGDGFFALDRDWRLTYVNAAAECRWARRREDLLGRDIRLVFPHLAGSALGTAIAAAFTGAASNRLQTTDPARGNPVEADIVANDAGTSVYFRDRLLPPPFGERDDILAMAEESAGIGVWDIDIATGMLRGTAQFFRIMGLEPTTEPMPIETTRRLRHPDDRDRVAEGFNKAVASGVDYFESEYRIAWPDGRLRWIFGRGRVIRDAAGTPARYSGVDVDITDRRLGEAALRETEARFRRVFEQSPLGKAMAGADFRFRAVNPALCDMLGYAAEELIGRSFLDLVHPDDHARCAAMAQALVDGSAPQIQLEERFVRKSGDTLWVRVNVGPIRDADSNILYTLGIIENIDERKRMTQALQDSEQQLRVLNERLEQQAEDRGRQLASSRAQLQAFFDNSLDWLTLQRAKPDGRFVFEDLNPTSEWAYGLSRAQVIGRTVEEVLGAEATVPLQYFRECVRTGAPQRYVARRTMAGRTRTIDVTAVLVPGQAENGDKFIITAARDITEREQLEAQLRQAQKMEAIGQLTGGVAHDFNNLLAVIGGNAELARRRPTPNLTRQMDNILRATQRGVALTRQLLSFSRRHAASPQFIDPRVEVPRMAEMLRASLRGDIEMRVNVAADVWPIEADVAELEIALLNVAVNARDAMPQGGTFEIDVQNMRAGANTLNIEHVAIALRDSGVGIPPDLIGKVFDPFFTTKETGEGTGLGLSQVYGFAQQSGGAVSLESEPGRGTTITIRLPRTAKPMPAEHGADQPVATPTASGRILLVEDNPQVADVTAQMLRAMGFDVVVADRARKALEQLSASPERIDLLMTDVVMPEGMNGLDLAKQVRMRFPALPIILTSGYNDVVVDSTEFPMLRKPVPYDELYRAVCAVLDHASAPGDTVGAAAVDPVAD